MRGTWLGVVAVAAIAGCKRAPRDHDAAPPEPPAPRVIAKDVSQPHGLALDTTHVYWGDGPTLRRAPRTGGAFEDLCRTEGFTIESIAVAGDRVFFGVNGDGVFRIVPGGPCERIATADDPRTLAIVGTTLYYWDAEVREVALDAPAGAAAPARKTESYVFPGGLVADEAGVYWHNGARIWRRMPGGQPEPIGACEDFRSELALDADHVYWTVTWAHAVFRVPRSGGAPEYVTEWVDGGGLAVDAGWIYVSEPGGKLRAIASEGLGSVALGDANLHVFGANQGTAIAVGGRDLFLATDVVNYSQPADHSAAPPAIHGEVRMMSVPRYLGQVVRFTRPDPMPATTPRPSRLVLSVVHTERGKPVDVEQPFQWIRMMGDEVIGALRAGTLPLHVVTADPRAEEIVAAVRVELGDKAVIVLEAQERSGAALEVEPDRLAALWRGAPSR